MNRILLLVACAALVAVVSAGDNYWEYNIGNKNNTKFTFGPASSAVVNGKNQFTSKMSVDSNIPKIVHVTLEVSEMTASVYIKPESCFRTASIYGKFKLTCSALELSPGVINPMGKTICNTLSAVASEQSFTWDSPQGTDGSGTFKLSDLFSEAIKAVLSAADIDVTFAVTQDVIMHDAVAMSLVAQFYVKPFGLDIIDEKVDLAYTTLHTIGGISDYFVDCQKGSNVGKKCLILGSKTSLTCTSYCTCSAPSRTQVYQHWYWYPNGSGIGAQVSLQTQSDLGKSKDSNNAGLVGGIIGGFAVVILIIAAYWYYSKTIAKSQTNENRIMNELRDAPSPVLGAATPSPVLEAATPSPVLEAATPNLV